MANKMTQRDYFNEIIAMAEANGRTDLADFARGRIEVLDKKSANKKPTKTQEANEVLKDTIEDVLSESDKALTVTEILATGKFEALTSPQKISALLKQMIEAGRVVKSVEKKVSRFSVVVAESENEADAE